MTTMFAYNQELAMKGGQSLFISETGAYVGKISQAKWSTTKNGAKSLEISFETDDGMKSDYLSVFYFGKNGDIASGHNMIQAIMGCTGAKNLTAVNQGQDVIAPELIGKRVGLMLQKVLYTKQDGQDGYRFQILCPFSAASRKTVSEHLHNQPAERIDYLVAHTKDKDERDKQQMANQAQHAYYASTAPQTQPSQAQPWDGYSDQERNDFSDDDIHF